MKHTLVESDEKVFTIMEQGEDEHVSRQIGGVLISKHGAMIHKDRDKVFLTWDEIDLIRQERIA